MDTHLQATRKALALWRARTDDPVLADAFLALADRGQQAFRRQSRDAHFTASCWLVSADGARTLLTHHRKLDRWLQLGGHADGDTNLPAVALREAEEESGLAGLRLEGDIFDIDRHRIPARKDEPAHWHHDVRYVIRAGKDESFRVSHESIALAWRDIEDVAQDPNLDESLRRMARRWLQT